MLRLLILLAVLANIGLTTANAGTACLKDPGPAFNSTGIKVRKDFSSMGVQRAGDVPDVKLGELRHFTRRTVNYLERQYVNEKKGGAAAFLYIIDGDDLCMFAWVDFPRHKERIRNSLAQAGNNFYSVDVGMRAHSVFYKVQRGGGAQINRLSWKLKLLLAAKGRGLPRNPSRKPTFEDWISSLIFDKAEDSPDAQEATLPEESLDEILKAASNILFPSDVQLWLSKVELLTVMPSGPISLFPFYALYPFGDSTLAVEKLAINITAFPTELYEIQNAEPRPIWLDKDKIQIFGNPFPVDDPEWDFPTLPGALEEAKAVRDELGGNLLSGKAATAAELLSRAERSDLIYVAAHGMASESSPIDGGYLAMHRGRVTARQVQKLKLHSGLVVLSACQTGAGQVLDAGVIGLARAFQIAGAANTIMSLWNIDDQATKSLMTEFARNLTGRSPASALQQAMLATRKTYADPLLWAPFNVFGVGGKIAMRQ